MIELLIFCVMVALVILGEYTAIFVFISGMAIYAAVSGVVRKRRSRKL